MGAAALSSAQRCGSTRRRRCPAAGGCRGSAALCTHSCRRSEQDTAASRDALRGGNRQQQRAGKAGKAAEPHPALGPEVGHGGTAGRQSQHMAPLCQPAAPAAAQASDAGLTWRSARKLVMGPKSASAPCPLPGSYMSLVSSAASQRPPSCHTTQSSMGPAGRGAAAGSGGAAPAAPSPHRRGAGAARPALGQPPAVPPACRAPSLPRPQPAFSASAPARTSSADQALDQCANHAAHPPRSSFFSSSSDSSLTLHGQQQQQAWARGGRDQPALGAEWGLQPGNARPLPSRQHAPHLQAALQPTAGPQHPAHRASSSSRRRCSASGMAQPGGNFLACAAAAATASATAARCFSANRLARSFCLGWFGGMGAGSHVGACGLPEASPCARP